GHELKAGASGIENLTAARDKAWAIRFGGTNSVGNADVSDLLVHVSELPGNASSLCIERKSNPPHDTRAVKVGERLILADNLEGDAPRCSNSLQMIMKIE